MPTFMEGLEWVWACNGFGLVMDFGLEMGFGLEWVLGFND